MAWLTMLLILVAVPLALAALAYVALGPKKAGQLGFGLLITIFSMPVFFFCKAGLVFYVNRAATDADRKSRETSLAYYSCLMCHIGWSRALACAFWIKNEMDISDLSGMGSSGRPVAYVSNHASFFDIFMMALILPLHQSPRFKMIVSSHVYNMPIMGVIVKTIGHLAVPFKDTSEGATTFEVDKEALPGIMEKFEAHLTSGLACAWFPEGQVNRGDCGKLQQYRAGGLTIVVRNDVELWVSAFVGNAVTWPSKEPIGGIPAKIGGRMYRFCESTKEFLSAPECGKDDRERSIYLATKLQEKSQEIMDEYIAKGYKAGSNVRPPKADKESKKEE